MTRILPVVKQMKFSKESSNLICLKVLSLVDAERNFHLQHNVRHPLGIYNLSVSKTIRRLDSFLEHALQLSQFKTSDLVEEAQLSTAADLIEGVLYAATEHVDDVKTIVSTFYPAHAHAGQKKTSKKVFEELKIIRNRIAATANHIKHSHGRIQLFTADYELESETGVFFGYFCESFDNGTIGPNQNLHLDGGAIISFSVFAWELVQFIWKISNLLAEYVSAHGILRTETELNVEQLAYDKMLSLLLLLPTYTFDTQHPFGSIPVHVELESNPPGIHGLQGSIFRSWNKLNLSTFSLTGSAFRYSGDGTTKQFNIEQPRNVGLVHWT